MKIRLYKTNRKVALSPHMIACKERDGVLGNIELTHHTNIDDFGDYTVDPGSNVKVWSGIADELSKPGVFDKLARYFKK